MTARKKLFWILALIIIAAVIVVVCVSFVTGRHPTEYDGTLVKSGLNFSGFI